MALVLFIVLMGISAKPREKLSHNAEWMQLSTPNKISGQEDCVGGHSYNVAVIPLWFFFFFKREIACWQVL